MRVGLIAGRHQMPVEMFLINKIIEIDLLKKENFKDLKLLIKESINNFIEIWNPIQIDLYLTGLSRVQHLVIYELKKRGVEVSLFDFDRDTNEYFKIL